MGIYKLKTHQLDMKILKETENSIFLSTTMLKIFF